MKVLLRGVHLSLSDGLKAYVQEHLVEHIERLVRRRGAEIDISLVDNNGPKGGVDKECRVTVRLPGLSAIHVTETAETLHQAIDLARDRLENTREADAGAAPRCDAPRGCRKTWKPTCPPTRRVAERGLGLPGCLPGARAPGGSPLPILAGPERWTL